MTEKGENPKYPSAEAEIEANHLENNRQGQKHKAFERYLIDNLAKMNKHRLPDLKGDGSQYDMASIMTPEIIGDAWVRSSRSYVIDKFPDMHGRAYAIMRGEGEPLEKILSDIGADTTDSNGDEDKPTIDMLAIQFHLMGLTTDEHLKKSFDYIKAHMNEFEHNKTRGNIGAIKVKARFKSEEKYIARLFKKRDELSYIERSMPNWFGKGNELSVDGDVVPKSFKELLKQEYYEPLGHVVGWFFDNCHPIIGVNLISRITQTLSMDLHPGHLPQNVFDKLSEALGYKQESEYQIRKKYKK